MIQLNIASREREPFAICDRFTTSRSTLFTLRVVMAANVLNSDRAVVMSVYVVRAFVKLRELLGSSAELGKKLDELERKLTARQDVHEQAILQLFSQVRQLLHPPPPQPQPKGLRIGF